jgi:hypothetical protein
LDWKEKQEEEEEEEEVLLIFCPWLYAGTLEPKPLLLNNIIKHNTIIAGKTVRLLIFNFVRAIIIYASFKLCAMLLLY